MLGGINFSKISTNSKSKIALGVTQFDSKFATMSKKLVGGFGGIIPINFYVFFEPPV